MNNIYANQCDCCKEVWNRDNLKMVAIGEHKLSFCPDCFAEYQKTKALEEQRTGYWIMHFDEISPSDSTMECSECGEELTVMYVKGDYCPNCGSKNKVKHGDKKIKR